jgi:hypothetical protein
VVVAAGSRSIEHLGTAHDDAELAALKAAAAERLTAGQAVLDLGVASIEAHLSIVVAALAVSHRVDHQTLWNIKKFVRTARRYRTVKIKAGKQMLTADPHPSVRTSLSQVRTVGAQRNPSPENRTKGWFSSATNVVAFHTRNLKCRRLANLLRDNRFQKRANSRNALFSTRDLTIGLHRRCIG